MLLQIALALFIMVESFSFSLQSRIENLKKENLEKGIKTIGQQLKYYGKGFGTDLQSVFMEAIIDSTVYYSGKIDKQANFIFDKLKAKKQGDWHVFVIGNVSISKITQFSTGFSYYSDNDTWAFYYNVSPYAKQFMFMAIYEGNNGKSTNMVNSQSDDVGRGVDAEKVSVIRSIVSNLNNLPDILKYIQKYDSQRWSGISIPSDYNKLSPYFFATVSVSDIYVIFNNVQLNKVQSKLILYV